MGLKGWGLNLDRQEEGKDPAVREGGRGRERGMERGEEREE